MNNKHGMIKIQFPIQYDASTRLPFQIFHIGSMEHQHLCERKGGLDKFLTITNCPFIVINGC